MCQLAPVPSSHTVDKNLWRPSQSSDRRQAPKPEVDVAVDACALLPVSSLQVRERTSSNHRANYGLPGFVPSPR